MADYMSIMLNGLFTGIGVIFAHEIWDVVKKYKERIKYDTNKKEKTITTTTKEV